jgi:hypothetical protein
MQYEEVTHSEVTIISSELMSAASIAYAAKKLGPALQMMDCGHFR